MGNRVARRPTNGRFWCVVVANSNAVPGALRRLGAALVGDQQDGRAPDGRSSMTSAVIQDDARRKTGLYFQPFSRPLGTTCVMPYRLFGRADEPSDRRHVSEFPEVESREHPDCLAPAEQTLRTQFVRGKRNLRENPASSTFSGYSLRLPDGEGPSGRTGTGGTNADVRWSASYRRPSINRAGWKAERGIDTRGYECHEST